MGDGDFPRVRRHDSPQVSFFSILRVHSPQLLLPHHSPSADTVLAFAERFRLERGQLVGPRIFQTGTILYGAGAPVYHEDIVSMEDARSALLRIKVEGGPSSFSYKNYNLPSRYVLLVSAL